MATLRDLLTDRDIGKFTKLQQSFIYSVRANAKRHGKWVTGRSASLLRGDVIVDDDTITFKFGAGDGGTQHAGQFGQLKTGRKAGKVPANLQDIIYEWSKLKGISFTSDKERESFAYFTAKKIKNEGTLQYRQGNVIDIWDSLYRQFCLKADTYVNMFKEDCVRHEIETIESLFITR